MTEVDYFAKITATKEIDLQTLLLINMFFKKKERKKERKERKKSNIRFHHSASLHIYIIAHEIREGGQMHFATRKCGRFK